MRVSIKESICLVLLSVVGLAAQGRTVASASTGEPIIYASVGVINRNLGTVTDTVGNFSLSIPAEYVNDSVRISSVGFVAQTFAVGEIHNLLDAIYLVILRMMLLR